jgi:hypothetical protein
VQNYADLLNIARKHELGEEARRDLFSKGARLIRKIKPTLLRHAVHSDGCYKRTWNNLSRARIANFGRRLAEFLRRWINWGFFSQDMDEYGFEEAPGDQIIDPGLD